MLKPPSPVYSWYPHFDFLIYSDLLTIVSCFTMYCCTLSCLRYSRWEGSASHISARIYKTFVILCTIAASSTGILTQCNRWLNYEIQSLAWSLWRSNRKMQSWIKLRHSLFSSATSSLMHSAIGQHSQTQQTSSDIVWRNNFSNSVVILAAKFNLEFSNTYISMITFVCVDKYPMLAMVHLAMSPTYFRRCWLIKTKV